MSQINLHEIIQQQQKQLAAIQAQIQALLAARGVEGGVIGSNMGLHMEVAKSAIFNEGAEKVGEFVTMCRLYLRMKMKEGIVEEQVQ